MVPTTMQEAELRKKYINNKENKLKREYLNVLNNVSEGTIKQELYEIFKDEVDIINGREQ